MTKEEHIVNCPNCNANFDMSNYIYHLKERFFDIVEEAIKQLKEEKE